MAIQTRTTITTVTEPGAPPALVHDYLLFLRGAERAFAAIAGCWPQAPIYTIAYSPHDTDGAFDGRSIHTSPLQRLRPSRRSFRAGMPLYPWAVGRLRPPGPVVVSSSFGFAHGVAAQPGACHICYCHTPFRYVWQERERALASVPALARPALRLTLDRIRRWDLAASRRVTHYVANSQITRQRIGDFYGRDAELLHPPVDVDRFSVSGEVEDWFLVVGELVAHKRTADALEAARVAGARIKVVGGGPRLERLRAAHGDHAEFLGRVPDAELARLYARTRALVVPNVEEFGITAVEAQAAGRPVIGLDAGGSRETILDGSTGVLVGAGSGARGLAEAMSEVDFGRFSASKARANAERFATARFQRRLGDLVDRLSG